MNHSFIRANQLTADQQKRCEQANTWLNTHCGVAADLSSDARKIHDGDVFMAYAFDAKHDGRAYISQACRHSVGAVMWQDDAALKPMFGDVPNLAVAELNVLAGHIAHAYYGQPSTNMRMIALTGTNGKTSCAQWIAQMLTALQNKCALMGTLGVGFADAMIATGFTTPQAIEVHRLLRDVRMQGAQAVAMEVSSHALDQGRVNGVAFDVALFTNFSRDHLDYHGDMVSYEAAKARLFTWQSLNTAVINTDDEVGLRMMQIAVQNGIKVIGYGFSEQPADVSMYLRATRIDAVGAQTVFEIQVDDALHEVRSALVGDFNVLNLLGVLGVLQALGFTLEQTIPLCTQIVAAPGRMQRFGGAHQPLVVVDFAHTPDALEKTLRALAPIAAQRGGKLTCVFGCGGDRDSGKRPQMGALAAQLADHVWITSDNPRTENPTSIIEQIVAGVQDIAQVNIEVDRRSAIAQAVANSDEKDVILVAGKGHEAYQEINGAKHPYSDLAEVSSALTQWMRTA